MITIAGMQEREELKWDLLSDIPRLPWQGATGKNGSCILLKISPHPLAS